MIRLSVPEMIGAEEIAAEIMKQPDAQQNEYAAVIYRDQDGSLQRTELVTDGRPDGVRMTDIVNEVGIDNVVATVHNHPGDLNGSRNPSFGDSMSLLTIQKYNSPEVDDRIIHGYIVYKDGSVHPFPQGM